LYRWNRDVLCRPLPWEKLFQNLRATRATELVSQGWPEYKVCAWLGHTEAVAKKHYWQVTDDDYQRRRARVQVVLRRCN